MNLFSKVFPPFLTISVFDTHSEVQTSVRINTSPVLEVFIYPYNFQATRGIVLSFIVGIAASGNSKQQEVM